MSFLHYLYSLANSDSSTSSSSSIVLSSSIEDDSEYLFCTDTLIEDMVKPHRIPVTIIASFSATCMIAGSIYLLFQRNSFEFRRKAALYLVLATVGLLLYIRDSLAIVWTFPAYDCDNASFILYYIGAVPFHLIPLIIRSWRTFCIYRGTPNILTCRKDTILSERVRRHAWMTWRITISYIPFLLVLFFLILNQDVAYYLWIAVEVVYSGLYFALAWKLYSMRGELKSKFLDETKSFFIYATIAIIEVIYSNTVYIITYSDDQNAYLIIYYMYGDIILVSAMWFLTGGRTIYHLLKMRKEIKDSELKSIPKGGTINVTLPLTSSSTTNGSVIIR